ncbi:Transcriptional regulator [Gaiella occulta]|uniref:Transcriptional regulator n=1 Tax=Gaiella occulta TaxID=1002870 RepID=A0A7M2Z1X3_9ACTN|nr:GntR family transcriptional regulator [Gaiella occulta]RDI76065.1 Transcriptional regulator [Gaiella occulta]
MDTFERRTPHYLLIYREVKEKIASGEFAAGERLPTQRKLSEQFGVTVMTVRQALQLLEQEELVLVRHGLGTFVAPTRIRYAMGNLRSLAQEVTAQGLELRTRVLSRKLVRPHPRVADLLRLAGGERVYAIERLRFVGPEPIVYQYSQLQPWLADALDGADLSDVSLYDHLHEQLGLEITRAQEWIRAIDLSPHEADLLHEESGTAALLSERLTLSVDDEPILFDRAYLPGDRVSLATERHVSDVTVGYQVRLSEEVA